MYHYDFLMIFDVAWADDLPFDVDMFWIPWLEMSACQPCDVNMRDVNRCLEI